MRNKFIKTFSALLMALVLFVTLSSSAFAAQSYSVKYYTDVSTATKPAAFGTSAADGRIWVDKSLSENASGGFDVELSALAQEYISHTASITPGGDSSEKALAADVTFILDMSTSMSAYTDVDDGTGNKISRLAAMVAATNDAISIIMDANPENRVAVYWFGGAVSSTHVGTFIEMGSYRLTSGKDWLTVSNSTVKTSSYLRKLGADGKYSTVTAVSQGTGAGTPMQNGIIFGIQKAITDISGKASGSIGPRQPYVFLLSDGAASIGNASWWTVPSSPTTASSYRNRGALTGNTSTGSQTVAAATILTAAYQKDKLIDAYKSYNGGKEHPITFYTVGLGPDSAINGNDNYAWCALNPGGLNTLYNPGSGTTPNNPSSASATNTKSQIATYVASAGSTYSGYGSSSKYSFSTYYQYADTYPRLDAAFNKLAVEVQAATKSVTMPTVSMEDSVSGTAVDSAVVFTDTLGEGMELGGPPMLGTKVGTLSGDIYSFDGLQSTVKIAESGGVTTLIWNFAASDMRSNVFTIVDPDASTISYSAPANPLKLKYTAKLSGSIDPSTNIYEYYSGLQSAPAEAVYTPTRDNPYYYSTNKYVGHVGKLSEVGYPSVVSDITHYVKGTVIGAQAAGTSLSNVYVTSAMVETAPQGTFSTGDIGKVITSLTMPQAGAYANAIAVSIGNCATANGSDAAIGVGTFAFKSGVFASGGSVVNKTENKSGTLDYSSSENRSSNGVVTTRFGNNGKIQLEMGIALSAPESVLAGESIEYTVTLYNYTNTEKTGVSVALFSEMQGEGGFSQLGIQSLGFQLPQVTTIDNITVPANGTATLTSTVTPSNSEGSAYLTEAVITKINNTSTDPNPPTSNEMSVTVVSGSYSAKVIPKLNGNDWANPSKVITLMPTGGGSEITDLTAVSPGYYEVYEDGTPTGVIIVVNGIDTEIELNYYSLNLVAGSGIDSVTGGGTYLAGQEVNINAIVTGLQPIDGSGGGTATIYGVKDIVDGEVVLHNGGDWSGYRWDGWTTNNDTFAVPSGQVAKITMPAYGLTLIANATDSTPAVDVQGKVVEGINTPKYKIDIAWGAMTFDYSVGNYWNPDTHSYDGGKIDAWLPLSFHQNGNNLITTYNHSNADVLVSFDVKDNALEGVTMSVNETNSDLGAKATGVPLPRVPQERADAPSIPAYLWLTGSPTNINALEYDKYIKAAVITVTIEAVQGSVLTPKDE